METVDLPLSKLHEAAWNPNAMDEAMLIHLRESIHRFGLVVPLVVRPIEDDFEVLSGNQRLHALTDAGFDLAPCVVVDLDDAHARILAQALNRLHGEDDLGMRAELLRVVLEHIPEREVLALLPESAEGLRELVTLGQQDVAAYLQSWQQAQAARLRHFTAQLTGGQWALVEQVIGRFKSETTSGDEGNPNRQGLALYQLCKEYTALKEGER
jgi:ParB family chromosome partitioning protein